MMRLLCRCMSTLSLPNQCFIGGKWTPSLSGKVFDVTNPATGDKICQVPDCNTDDTNQAIDAANIAFQTWKLTIAKERSKILRRAFELHEKYQTELSQILCAEGGKVIKEAVGEIKYGASYFEWFSEEARRIYGDIVPPSASNRQMMFVREPAGVAALITPWNFPNAMLARKVSAALAAGCTCVIKPAEDTPLSALAICKILEEAGVPPGVVNIVTSSKSGAKDIGETLCASHEVRVLSFTGSTPVGKLLMAQSAASVKKIEMELGGNAPFIVFKSADIDVAVSSALNAKFRHNGQTCIAANRFFIDKSVHDEFVEKLCSKIRSELKIGDPLDTTTTSGPLINQQAVKKVENHVSDAVFKGGNIILGGKRSEYGDNYYEPTVITNVTDETLMFNEETFGPVAGIMKFDCEDEAIELANGTNSGLAGYFFSTDYKQIWRVAGKLRVGMLGINEGLISCAEAAFGGVKESGLGREGSMMGVKEYLDVKYICLGDLS